MSIQKIDHIGAIGRFRNYKAQGDVTFKKFTLIFGENGRGKTTLCAILRSMQSNNPDIITGRKTLGQNSQPNVVMTFGGTTVQFNRGAWKNPSNKLRIFDAQYVADNVYLGDAIGTDQRRNLCRLILGQEGIAFAKAYDDADDAITEMNAAIRQARQTLTAHVDLTQLEQFLGLEADAEIEAKIDQKHREIEGLRQIDSLRSRPGMEVVEMPPLPNSLERILNQTLEFVSREAEQRVREHLAAHGMQGNEEWIARGMPHMRDDCPFCGQSLDSIELIESSGVLQPCLYAVPERTGPLHKLACRYYSDDAVNLLAQKLETNKTAAALWERYVPFDSPDESELGNISHVIFAFRSEMLSVLKQKSANSLDVVSLPQSYHDAYEAMASLKRDVEAYNEAVKRANEAINAFKRSATPQRLPSAQNELRWLELTKLRHEEPVKTAADNFQKLTAEKEALDKAKAAARDKLDEYGERVVARHLKAINDHLGNFNAGFSLDKLKVEYSGRVPNSTFCVVINRTSVEMGNSETPLDQPSFKNTLSGGDRTTLALAFFLAQIADEPGKDKCVAVFDDPFNSQDRFRRTYTINQIARCGRDVAQVVVLSHDNSFLREMWDRPLPKDNRKALSLVPCGHEDTLLVEWNIEEDTEGEDAANKRILRSFLLDQRGRAP